MATNFPGSLDTLTNPTSGDALNSPDHAGQHSDANDAVEALQAKVGVDSSVVTSSHDYKINQLETNNTGTNTGDETTTSVGSLVSGATAKTTPVDADNVAITDSAATHILKKVTWANIKATLKTYFDTLYQAAGSYITASSSDTLTNKTFDANGTGNSLSNVDVADLANGTDGQLITWDAAGAPTTVATGTATQVLTSNGAGAAPTFQDAASGGFTSQFRATRTNNQTISSASATKVEFSTEQFDTGNEYDPTTNYRFTPANAGYYQINANVYLGNLSSDKLQIISIYKNGVAHSQNLVYVNTYGGPNAQISDVVYSDGNDYFEIYIQSTDGDYVISGSDTYNFFSGFRVA